MPLIPNVEELTSGDGADFSAASNVTITFRADQQFWEITAGEASVVEVYAEDGDAVPKDCVTLPIIGGVFAILLEDTYWGFGASTGENFK
jgi:hypothetical protein